MTGVLVWRKLARAGGMLVWRGGLAMWRRCCDVRAAMACAKSVSLEGEDEELAARLDAAACGHVGLLTVLHAWLGRCEQQLVRVRVTRRLKQRYGGWSALYCRGAPVGSEAPGGRALGADVDRLLSRRRGVPLRSRHARCEVSFGM